MTRHTDKTCNHGKWKNSCTECHDVSASGLIPLGQNSFLGKGKIKMNGVVVAHSDGKGNVKWTPPLKYKAGKGSY